MRGLFLVPLLFVSCSSGEPTEPQDAGTDLVLLDYTSDSAPGCDWVETSRTCIDPWTVWVTASSLDCDDPEQNGMTLSMDIPCDQGEACINDDTGVRCK